MNDQYSHDTKPSQRISRAKLTDFCMVRTLLVGKLNGADGVDLSAQ